MYPCLRRPTPGRPTPFWVRRAALHAMVEGTAISQIGWTLKTKTSQPQTFHQGQMIEYWRKPATKDTSGWHGPCRVVRMAEHLGQVIVIINNQDRPCRIQDCRAAIMMVISLYNSTMDNSLEVEVVRRHICQQQQGVICSIGLTCAGGRIRLTKATREYPILKRAILRLCSTTLALRRVVAVSLGWNISKLKGSPLAEVSTIIYWPSSDPTKTTIYSSKSGPVNIARLIGPDRQTSNLFRFYPKDPRIAG